MPLRTAALTNTERVLIPAEPQPDYKVILGQEPDANKGRLDFDESQAFCGKLTDVNLWSRVLDPTQVHAHYARCRDDQDELPASLRGDIIDWVFDTAAADEEDGRWIRQDVQLVDDPDVCIDNYNTSVMSLQKHITFRESAL